MPIDDMPAAIMGMDNYKLAEFRKFAVPDVLRQDYLPAAFSEGTRRRYTKRRYELWSLSP